MKSMTLPEIQIRREPSNVQNREPLELLGVNAVGEQVQNCKPGRRGLLSS